jgi:hypothetical protein
VEYLLAFVTLYMLAMKITRERLVGTVIEFELTEMYLQSNGYEDC